MCETIFVTKSLKEKFQMPDKREKDKVGIMKTQPTFKINKTIKTR